MDGAASPTGAAAPAIRGTKPEERFVRALTEQPGHVPASFLFARGDHEQPKQELEPAGLSVVSANFELPGVPVDDEVRPTTGRRTALAQRLTDPQYPLLARVIVNRVWEQIFGRGLVETMEEFGSQGEPPTHPELLDWLANNLVYRYQWRLKPLIRDIVTSGTYQQESEIDSLKLELDPDNHWLSRGARVRLSSEQIRDQILTVSDLLNPAIGGPSVIIPELGISTSNTPAWALTEE